MSQYFKTGRMGIITGCIPTAIAAMYILAKANPDGGVKGIILPHWLTRTPPGFDLWLTSVYVSSSAHVRGNTSVAGKRTVSKHACAYCRLYPNLNKWDGLIFFCNRNTS